MLISGEDNRGSMTDEEKRQRAQLEHAQGEFVRLQEQAKLMAETLERASKKLLDNAALLPSQSDSTAASDSANLLEPQDRQVLNFDSVAKVIQSLRAARQNLFALQQRQK